jgi:hypothetical protein
MRILRFAMIVFLITFICNSRVFCQFRVIPQINLEIDVEDGYLYPPHKLVLVGIDDDNNVVRNIEFDFVKRNYSIYAVKPGKYLLLMSDDNAGICFQYQTGTIIYPDEDAFYRKNTGYLNEIEVYNNRNLKLKITFKMHEDYHGYQKVMDVKYKDFDYSEIIFYSTPFSGELKTNILAANQDPYIICGNNTGWTERSLNFKCSLDGGNIEINIKKAYFENEYKGERSAGYTKGNTTLGPVTSSNQVPRPLIGGFVSTTGYFLDNDAQNNPHPNDWDAIIVKAECDKAAKKCKIIIDYNVAVRMETVIWKKEEMCKEKISYDNKPLYDNNNSMKSKCYCDCYLEAIIAHEAKHCENWIDSADRLSNILQRFCSDNNNNFKTITCCGDEDCQKHADDNLKYQIFFPLNTKFVNEIINRPWISSPERPSEIVELATFRRCGRPCKYKYS